MEKVFVWITGIDADVNGDVRFLYDVVIKKDQEIPVRYSCQKAIDTTLSTDANIDTISAKVAADAVARGFKVTTADVVLPKPQTIAAPIDAQPTLTAQMMNGIRSIMQA